MFCKRKYRLTSVWKNRIEVFTFGLQGFKKKKIEFMVAIDIDIHVREVKLYHIQ